MFYYQYKDKGCNNMSIQLSGKIINNYYSNYNFWSATFKFFGVNKTDGNRLLGLEHRPLDKI